MLCLLNDQNQLTHVYAQGHALKLADYLRVGFSVLVLSKSPEQTANIVCNLYQMACFRRLLLVASLQVLRSILK